MIKTIIKIILFIVIAGFGIGIYLQQKQYPIADKIIGLTVLLMVFVLLPLFLYHRYKDKSIEDFQFKKTDKDNG